RAGLMYGALSLVLPAGYLVPALLEQRLSAVESMASSGFGLSTLPLSELVDGRFFAVYGDQTYRLHWPQAVITLGLLIALGALWLFRRRDGAALLFGAGSVLLLAALLT